MVAPSDIAARIVYAYAPRDNKRSAGAVRVLAVMPVANGNSASIKVPDTFN